MKIVLAIDPEQPSAGYREGLLAAGARPDEVLIVQPGDPLPDDLDGLLLAGGVDVEPERYGESRLNATVETNPERDALDFELLARAERLGAPVFGICRGLQVVNVAHGGTLWQDLPAQRPRGVPHSFPRREGNDPARPAHALRVARGLPPSLPLAEALSTADGTTVNSRHHQAVKDLAPGLVALAASPDDLVEALARPGGPFLAAVQWHPENLLDRADQRALFADFLAAARRRPGSSSPQTEPRVVPSSVRPEAADGPAGQNTAPSRAEAKGADTALPSRGPDGAPEPA